MGFLDNLKNKQFWIEVLKLGVIFFVLFMGFSLLFAQFSNVFSGNFAQIYQEEWADGKWLSDVALKGSISLVYAMYMVSKRMSSKPNLHN